MVNIFGKDSVQGKKGDRGTIGPKGESGVRGRIGKRGRAGRDGIVDLYNWMSATLLQNFQVDSEECCFLIRKGRNNVRRNKGKDIICSFLIKEKNNYENIGFYSLLTPVGIIEGIKKTINITSKYEWDGPC